MRAGAEPSFRNIKCNFTDISGTLKKSFPRICKHDLLCYNMEREPWERRGISKRQSELTHHREQRQLRAVSGIKQHYQYLWNMESSHHKLLPYFVLGC